MIKNVWPHGHSLLYLVIKKFKKKDMIIAPKTNFDWKLDERVKEWINLLSKDEKIKFMNLLNDELLENLYVWRLGFNIPELREDRITCLASI